jgi:hypothetical protein
VGGNLSITGALFLSVRRAAQQFRWQCHVLRPHVHGLGLNRGAAQPGGRYLPCADDSPAVQFGDADQPPTRSGVTQQASARSPAWFLIRAPNRRPRSPLPPTIRPIWDTGCSAPTAASSTFSGRSGSGSPVPVSSVAPRSTAPASRWPTRRPAWLSSDRGTTPASGRTTSDRPGRSPGSPWFRWGRLLAGCLGRRCHRPRRPPARPAAPSFGSVGALTVNRSTGQLTA